MSHFPSLKTEVHPFVNLHGSWESNVKVHQVSDRATRREWKSGRVSFPDLPTATFLAGNFHGWHNNYFRVQKSSPDWTWLSPLCIKTALGMPFFGFGDALGISSVPNPKNVIRKVPQRTKIKPLKFAKNIFKNVLLKNYGPSFRNAYSFTHIGSRWAIAVDGSARRRRRRYWGRRGRSRTNRTIVVSLSSGWRTCRKWKKINELPIIPDIQESSTVE